MGADSVLSKAVESFMIDNILNSKNVSPNEVKHMSNKVEKQNLQRHTDSRNNSVKPERVVPSYTSIIAQAILSSPDKKLSLGNIYEHIAKRYPRFLKKGKGWRNCVRHNLSLSECFIKSGRTKHGRGNDWGIHPFYLKNFLKGNYRKRRVNNRVRNQILEPTLHIYNEFKNTLNKPYMHACSKTVTSKQSFSIENILLYDKTFRNNVFSNEH